MKNKICRLGTKTEICLLGTKTEICLLGTKTEIPQILSMGTNCFETEKDAVLRFNHIAHPFEQRVG